MGMFGDMFGGVGKGVEGLFRADAAGKRENEIEQERRDYFKRLADESKRAGMVDYTPAYMGDNMPAYERSQSPVARAYLESMLTGQNPDDVAPTAAGGVQERQTAGFNDSYGSYEDLLARGEAYRKKQPWKTKTPGKVNQSAISYGSDPARPGQALYAESPSVRR